MEQERLHGSWFCCLFREATLGAVAQYRLASNGENKTSAYRRAEHDLASVPHTPLRCVWQIVLKTLWWRR